MCVFMCVFACVHVPTTLPRLSIYLHSWFAFSSGHVNTSVCIWRKLVRFVCLSHWKAT